MPAITYGALIYIYIYINVLKIIEDPYLLHPFTLGAQNKWVLADWLFFYEEVLSFEILFCAWRMETQCTIVSLAFAWLAVQIASAFSPVRSATEKFPEQHGGDAAGYLQDGVS